MKIEYTRPKLTKYQTEIIDSEKRFTICEASTKSGKTVSHIVWLFEQALGGKNQKKQGMEYWWVAPVFAQAKIAFNRMQRFLNIPNFFKVNISELSLTLPNGAVIRFKSADKPDSLYGENVYAAVFDEFTRAKEMAWFALRSTLTATQAPCKLIGNYTGATNWGHKLSKKALEPNSDYAYFKVNAWDAVREGILEESEIWQAKNDLPEPIFKALYLAEGTIDDSLLFEQDALFDMFTNEYVLNAATNKRYLTADIALQGSDKFVIVVWQDWAVIHIEEIAKSDGEQVLSKIKSVANRFNVAVSNIAFDADGVGGFLKGFLRTAVSFVNHSKALKDEQYANLKSQCFFRLAKQVNERTIYIKPQNYKSEIIQELEQVKAHQPDKEGKLRVIPKDIMKQLLGHSPDFADALMMRSYFDLKQKFKSKSV